jgi:hypothetical protein
MPVAVVNTFMRTVLPSAALSLNIGKSGGALLPNPETPNLVEVPTLKAFPRRLEIRL